MKKKNRRKQEKEKKENKKIKLCIDNLLINTIQKLFIFIFPLKISFFFRMNAGENLLVRYKNKESIPVERTLIRCKIKKLSLFLQSVPRLSTLSLGIIRIYKSVSIALEVCTHSLMSNRTWSASR